jgi:hypothetical protein
MSYIHVRMEDFDHQKQNKIKVKMNRSMNEKMVDQEE